MHYSSLCIALAAFSSISPVHAAPSVPAEKRQLLDALGLKGLLLELNSALDATQLLSILENESQTLPSPTSVPQAMSRLSSAYAAATPTGFIESAAEIIAESLSPTDLEALAAGYTVQNNPANNNPRNPSKTIYPKKIKQDAPYSQTETEMRQQIYIPSTFTYGKKPPVILVPGTGARGGNNFNGNLIKLLSGKSYADIVWLNPPGFQLADAQQNAETVAYAINYISGISGNKNVSIVGWSQGSLSMQWALKFWPSTRKIVTDQVAVSADYHGTKLANLVDTQKLIPLPPAIYQQNYNSQFVKALRSNGGDSAYVPTTTIYSSFFDEIVEPQQGAGASAFLLDARRVGVTNNDVQLTCPPGTFAGGFNTHESMLSNAFTFAMIQDALTHDGPGRAKRLNLQAVCSQVLAPGLSLEDFLATESTIPIAGFEILTFPSEVLVEPPLKSYAQNQIASY